MITPGITEADVGKRFRTQGGDEASVAERSASGMFGVIHPDGIFFHAPDGTVPGLSNTGDKSRDLISRIEESPQLSLEVGEVYETEEEGILIELIYDRDSVFCARIEHEDSPLIGISQSGTIYAYDRDGISYYGPNLTRKHTPPPEVNPAYVTVFEDGSSCSSTADLSTRLDDHELEEIYGSPISHVIRFDPPWEPGRRDDLKEAGQ